MEEMNSPKKSKIQSQLNIPTSLLPQPHKPPRYHFKNSTAPLTTATPPPCVSTVLPLPRAFGSSPVPSQPAPHHAPNLPSASLVLSAASEFATTHSTYSVQF